MSAPGPAAARRRTIGSDSGHWVAPVSTDRLPLRVAPVAGLDLAGWARENPGTVDSWLDRHGAVLFSGFAFGPGGQKLDPTAFSDVLDGVLGGAPAAYVERSSPRRELVRGVFTSTEQPADQPIFLHNENAYQRNLPTRLAFGCVVAATQGGATPLSDCRQVLAGLPGAIADRFRAVGVRYTRVFGNGVGLSWQESFATDDPDEVERYCVAEGIVTHWHSADVLRTEQVRPAVSKHPRTGEEVWLNHVGLFGPYGTPPAVRQALIERLGGDNLPLQVSFGDGTPIGEDVHRLIRDAYASATVARPWHAGEVLVVDNLLVAHGREPFAGDRLVLVGMSGQFQPGTVPA